MRLGKDRGRWSATRVRTNDRFSIQALHRALSPQPPPPLSDSAAGVERSPIASAHEKPHHLDHGCVDTWAAALTIGYGRAWEDRVVARREGIGARLKRLRLGRGLSQRDLSSPGISYAYISRIESGARTPSVKALRRIAGKLGVTVEHLETGEPTSTELGVADAAVEYGSLTTAELRLIQAAVEERGREAARRAAEQVITDRQEAERAELRKRLDELGG